MEHRKIFYWLIIVIANDWGLKDKEKNAYVLYTISYPLIMSPPKNLFGKYNLMGLLLVFYGTRRTHDCIWKYLKQSLHITSWGLKTKLNLILKSCLCRFVYWLNNLSIAFYEAKHNRTNQPNGIKIHFVKDFVEHRKRCLDGVLQTN